MTGPWKLKFSVLLVALAFFVFGSGRIMANLGPLEAWGQIEDLKKPKDKGASESDFETADGQEEAAVEEPALPPELPKPTAGVSPETLRMIEMIEKKNRELKRREEQLKIKEQALKALEQKILDDLKMVDQALAKSQEHFGIRKDLIEKNINSLVKVYSAMKPVEASKLLGTLDEDIAVQIISRMKPKTAGKVIAKMNLKVAKAISEKIAGKQATKMMKDEAEKVKSTAP